MSENDMTAAPAVTADSEDYRGLMEANLLRVFGERDATRRAAAIREIYASDAMLHEPVGSVHGHDAIAAAVTHLQSTLPPDFVFNQVRPAVGHHGVGRLQWRSGPAGGPTAVTGLDVAHIREGKIQSLHVFLDQPDTSAL